MKIGEVLYVLFCTFLACMISYAFGYLFVTFATGWVLDAASASGYYLVCEPGYTDIAMSCDLVKN